MVCFLFITPLAAISGWLCLRGAQDHLHFNSRLEAVGLIALTIALFTIYVLWTLVLYYIQLNPDLHFYSETKCLNSFWGITQRLIWTCLGHISPKNKKVMLCVKYVYKNLINILQANLVLLQCYKYLVLFTEKLILITVISHLPLLYNGPFAPHALCGRSKYFFAICPNNAVKFTEGNIRLTMKIPLFTHLYATLNLSNDILIVEQSTIR